jgi:hypothetical protein
MTRPAARRGGPPPGWPQLQSTPPPARLGADDPSPASGPQAPRATEFEPGPFSDLGGVTPVRHLPHRYRGPIQSFPTMRCFIYEPTAAVLAARKT